MLFACLSDSPTFPNHPAGRRTLKPSFATPPPVLPVDFQTIPPLSSPRKKFQPAKVYRYAGGLTTTVRVRNHTMRIEISDPLQVLILAPLIVALLRIGRGRKTIVLGPIKFRDLIASQSNPIVIRTKVGFIRQKWIYVFPYQGVCFQTDIRSVDFLPSGITVVRDERGVTGAD